MTWFGAFVNLARGSLAKGAKDAKIVGMIKPRRSFRTDNRGAEREIENEKTGNVKVLPPQRKLNRRGAEAQSKEKRGI